MNHDGISVIIPVYNAEKTIEKCINSILSQTFSNLQIICVDDGSLDHSLSILGKMGQQDHRIEIISQTNSGVSAARNNGIMHAVQKYITFVDSDDEIDPFMYEKMISHLENNHLECVICGICDVEGDKKQECILPWSKECVIGKENVFDQIVKPMLGFSDLPRFGLHPMWNKIFLKSILDENNILVNENRSHGEDWEFCINYFRFIHSAGFVHEALYHHIIWSKESLINKFRPNYLEIELYQQRVFREWYPELKWSAHDKQLLDLPVRSAEYYRLNMNGVALTKKVDSIYDICMSDDLWKSVAAGDEHWKKIISEKSKFTRWIWKRTTPPVIIHNIKKQLKKFLR